jgi:hypothetical protein
MSKLPLRRMSRRLRHFWPEALVALLLALPWLALFGLGFVWLWQNERVLEWAIGAAILAAAGMPLRRLATRRAAVRAAWMQDREAFPEAAWNAEEAEAWDKVVAFAEATPPLDYSERDRAEEVARQTIELVARHFRPEAPEPMAQVTLPEALLLGEILSRRLRGWVLKRIPGARQLKISHVLWAQRMEEKHGAAIGNAINVADTLWRGLRVGLNPVTAVAQEANRLFFGRATDFLAGNLRTALTRQLVLETGRAAIELYSGRMRLSAHELADAARADTGSAEGEAPLRLLLVGQANSGKTSLLNALAGSLRGEVSPLPGEAGTREHLVTQEGRPALTVADMPPLANAASFLEQARRADAILWVASATQPGRAMDLAALTALRQWAGSQSQRRVPPLAVAVTGVDLLRPAGSWTPPYPPDARKARSIRAAVEAVASALELPEASVIPVALPPGGTPWNIEALWAHLANEMDAARAARLERLRDAEDRFDFKREAGKVGQLGLDAVRAMLRKP